MIKSIVKLNFFLFFLGTIAVFSQTNDAIVQKPNPATGKKLDSLMQLLNSESLKENKLNYDFNVLMSAQNSKFNALNEQIQKANTILKEGIDYKGFTSELALLVKWKEQSVTGIIKNKSKMQTVRDLTTTSVLLNELLKRTKSQLEKISANNKSLSSIQRKIDSMAIDELFYKIPVQESAKKNYYQRMTLTTKDLALANTNLKNAIDSIQKLEIKGNIFKYDLESDIAFLKNARKTLNDKTSTIASDVIQSKDGYSSLGQNFKHSFVKGYLLFVFYIANQTQILTVMFIFIIGLVIYLRVIRSKYKKANMYEDLKYPGHVLNYPIASSLLIMISIFQFFLPTPPFVFNAFIWMISGIALTIILRKSVVKYWFYVWIAFFILNNISFQDNLFLLYSPGESRFILLMSIIGLVLGFFILKNRKKEGKEIKEKSFAVAIVVFIVLEFIAIICIFKDSYNLGKILMTNGYFTIFIAYQLMWAFGLSLDVLNLSKDLTQSEEEILNAQEGLKEFKVSAFIYLLFGLGWYVLLSRNTYSFQNFMQPIADAFYEKQQFGEFSFSFNSIFLFFFILFMSGLSARIVSFLTTESKTIGSGSPKSGLGSWLLLIRIAIITLGVLIAFISFGIPMDKIALMISALSVGIGFGLQNVINNLVSGLIIAFEKPINLDDIVEVGGNMGKMKSIGIRSSVITTWDGADVIIPNGDLLSQHLVNWTMGSNRRRYEIDLGVAYGTDLNQVKSILIEVLNQHELVLKNPTPMVWVTKFNDSAIDFTIKYWVPHFNFGNDVRNDLIIAIDVAFKTNGIEIPFPQQEVYVQSFDSRKEAKLENSSTTASDIVAPDKSEEIL
ncbi:mechanosensitive ion channel family protein [Flavobacterium nackdongense]|uniref:Mechanosensitive ion channel n=1 Tax=Flavobacterium nackdongense TaxID=2547394 RepID=A0A4P6Y5T2_9FLAO|nr:mechanosensitive ion channel domain-containing protein [Flavobacterium nackdongense]QBN17531.1 mechanosensitive ion channel [Flavobacterium nackdongense]